jgi:hypothetical protein
LMVFCNVAENFMIKCNLTYERGSQNQKKFWEQFLMQTGKQNLMCITEQWP